MSQLDQIYAIIGSNLDSRNDDEESQIQKFFAGKNILITGATGFMGKCLLEKILRSIPEVGHVYLLIRDKANSTIEERLTKFFKNKIFDPLREKNPHFDEKVTAVKGDVSLENCGLSDEDRETLIEKTNIIFHGAANVMFNARVDVSLNTNVFGTERLLKLAQSCKNLDVFMYLSTAYSHCYNKCIEEKYYKPPGDINAVNKLIEIDNQRHLDEYSVKEFIGSHPNIYTYSKAIAEELVRKHSHSAAYACGIYRPSIVVSTYKEPVAGWVDNLNGPVMIFMGAGLGVIHVAYHKCVPIEFIPCDMSINILLAMTWDLHDRSLTGGYQKEAVIYNYGSSTVNPTGLQELYDYRKYVGAEERSKYAVGMNMIFLTRYFYLFQVFHFLFHFIPACLLDVVLMVIGRKPQAVSVFWKVNKHLDKVDYWGNGNWRIHMSNTLDVMDRLNDVDKDLFYCDIRNLDWREWSIYMWRGMRLYLLKEDFASKKGAHRYYLLMFVYYGIPAAIFLYYVAKQFVF
ncbi:hypothetical protein QAD02_005250 [Eretmocerus hayati]|uniref:Uncharacterized protein n=1 Tax=Eretmocerus hayati TaxID=131215 RepID=A0ACC2NS18_9HYME|nr:hypothetical protein QAD02_005250 [Eretmocerus hayati]